MKKFIFISIVIVMFVGWVLFWKKQTYRVMVLEVKEGKIFIESGFEKEYRKVREKYVNEQLNRITDISKRVKKGGLENES